MLARYCGGCLHLTLVGSPGTPRSTWRAVCCCGAIASHASVNVASHCSVFRAGVHLCWSCSRNRPVKVDGGCGIDSAANEGCELKLLLSACSTALSQPAASGDDEPCVLSPRSHWGFVQSLAVASDWSCLMPFMSIMVPRICPCPVVSCT